jgi:hypothetical protein
VRRERMSYEHHKEDIIRRLQNLKKRIHDTILLVDKADNDHELYDALLNSPISNHAIKRR